MKNRKRPRGFKLQYARAALALKNAYNKIGESIKTAESAIKGLIGKYGSGISD